MAQGLEIGTTVRRRDKGAAALEIDERDRKDYFSPSAGVFGDYCSDVVGRYGLEVSEFWSFFTPARLWSYPLGV